MIRTRIRELRLEVGLTQEQLAARLGVSQQTVSRMERIGTEIPVELALKICKFYDVNILYLTGESDERGSYGNIGQSRQRLENENEEIVAAYNLLSDYGKQSVNILLRGILKMEMDSNIKEKR